MKLKSELKFDRQLETIRIGRHICFGGDGGGSAPTTSTTNTSNLPSYLEPYVTRNVAAAEGLADQPYQAYGGQRQADFNANQQGTQANIMGMRTPGQMGVATGATMNGMNTNWTNPGVSDAYMNPYQQNVTDIAKREASRQSGIQATTDDARFAKAGAFGGSRQGIVDAERERNLGQQQNDIQMQGLNQAYQQGVGQFNADRSNLMSGANQMAGIGAQQQQLDLGRYAAQAGVGQQQQSAEQQQLDRQYQDFVNQRDYGKQQANFMSGIIRGTPVTANSNVTTYQAPPDTMGQVAGLGIAGVGAYNAYNQPK